MKTSRGRARASTKPRSPIPRSAANSQDGTATTTTSADSSAPPNPSSATSRTNRGSSSTNRVANAAPVAAPKNVLSSEENSKADREKNEQSKQGAGYMKLDSELPQQRYQELKKKQEKERAELIRNGRMHDPNKPRSLAHAITLVGTCDDMCPEFERVERIVQNDVWGPEADPNAPPNEGKGWKVTPDESRMVKKFRRAAAGIDEQLPSELRPPAVLLATTDYLFKEVIGKARSLAQVHHFVWDRTRAIRNDFSIQQLRDVADIHMAIDCYERIARFHILSLHQFAISQKPYEQYDDKQEREQLDKTLLSLLQYYDDNKKRFKPPNEAEFRAYYIIFQISGHSADMPNKVQHWPARMLQSNDIRIALRLDDAASNVFDDKGPLQPFQKLQLTNTNWAAWWDIVESEEVPYLMACVAEIQFAINRRNALGSIWHAYKPTARAKIEDWTLSECMRPLGFEDGAEVETYVGQFGIAVSERADGQAFVDLASRQDKQLPPLTMALRKQVKTRFVEAKRQRRTFSAVIMGLSPRSAQHLGLIESGTEDQSLAEDAEMPDDDNLFLRSEPMEPKAQSKPRFNIPANLNPSAPTWQPSSSELFQSQKQTQFTKENQPISQAAQSAFEQPNSEGAMFGTPAGNNLGTSSAPPVTQTPFGSSIFQATSQPSASFTNNSTTSQPFNSPFQSPTVSSPFPTSTPQENVRTPTQRAANDLFPKSDPNRQQATFITFQAPVSYPSLPSFNAPSVAHSSFSNLPQSSQPTSQPLFSFPSNMSTAPASVSTSQPSTTTPVATMKAHKPRSSSPLAKPPLVQGSAIPQEEPQQFGVFNFDSDQPINSFSESTLPQPNFMTETTFFQQPNVSSFSQPAATSSIPAQSSSQLEFARNQKAIQDAKEQAETERRRTQTMDRVARINLLESGGLLEQWVEHHAGSHLRTRQLEMWRSRINEEARVHRLNHIKTKYFRKWRSIWWDRKVRREGKARRLRMKAAKEKRLEEERRRAQEQDYIAHIAALKQSERAKAEKVAAQHAAKQAKEQLASQSPNEVDKPAASAETSSMPPPPRPESPRSRVYNALGLSGPTSSSSHRRAQSALSESLVAKSPYANRPMRSSSLRNSFSPFSSTSSHPRVDSRVDKTKSTYFALKARGIDKIDESLNKKRPRTDDPTDALEAPPRKFTSTEVNGGRMNGTALTSSPPGGSTLSPGRAKDEELLAASRSVRGQMREAESFFRTEAEKGSLARSRTSPGSSPNNNSTTSSVSKYRAQVEAAWRDDPRDDLRPSSRHSINTPPAYRNRVSKFVPRELYASVRAQQRYDIRANAEGRDRISSVSRRGSLDSFTGRNSRIAERAQKYFMEEKDRIMRRSGSSEIDTNVAQQSSAGKPLPLSMTRDRNSSNPFLITDDGYGSSTVSTSFAAKPFASPAAVSEPKAISPQPSTNIRSLANPQQKAKQAAPPAQIPPSNNPFAALGEDGDDGDETESQEELDDGSSEDGEDEDGGGFTMSTEQAREHFGGKAGTSADDAIEL